MIEFKIIVSIIILISLLYIVTEKYKSVTPSKWKFIYKYFPMTDNNVNQFYLFPKLWINKSNAPNFKHRSYVIRLWIWYFGIQKINTPDK